MPFQLMDVEKEYEKDKNLNRDDIRILSEWIQKQPHLPKATELQLILFLHSCYYRIEAAKTAIDNFFTVRTLCPEIFGVPSIETLKQQLSVCAINVLPKKTPEGYAVIMVKIIDPNPDHYHCIPQINYSDLNLMLNLHHHGSCNGIVSIMDMRGLSFGHVTRFNMVAVKKHMFYVQEAAPIRIKGIHYINVVPFMDKIMTMVKPFMKKELVQMINFHTESLETLYKFVPKELLPKDYGGEAPSSTELHEQNTKRMLENMEFYKWLDTFKVDESKRPGKPKNSGDVFGVDGTFRKLEFD